MIPCLNKKLFGFDCPGCGIQRSLVHLFQGEFIAAFKMYPAIYTLLFLGGFMVFKNKIKKNNSRKIILILAVINILIILSSYIIKMKSTFNN
jgi:hypothetical protein